MKVDAVAAKYLANQAESLARTLPSLRSGAFDTAVALPAYDEEPDAVERVLGDVSPSGRHLVILVVNAPVNAPASAQRRNEELLSSVRDSGKESKLAAGVSFVERDAAVSVLLVDATSGPLRLAKGEGVGRARKIGLDVALALFQRGELHGPFAGSTDADVRLPTSYFETLQSAAGDAAPHGLQEFSALLFPYRHLLAKEIRIERAMRRVEMSFRYYVLGLARAGSPYAFHSLGSSLAVSLLHYARVRGVPNRQAGEDFYLLSKLSKLAPLRRLVAPTISIETRLSDRVPFGTGPSLRSTLLAPEDELGDHPASFEYLAAVQRALVQAAFTGEAPQFSAEVPAWALDFANNFHKAALPHLSACPSPEHRVRRLHDRFDALTTRQFIHQAHREGLRRLPICEAVRLAGFVQEGTDDASALLVLAQKEAALPGRVGPTVFGP